MLAQARSLIRRSALALGYKIERVPAAEHQPVYDSDNLTVRYKHLPFLQNPRFMSAYRRGTTGTDFHIEWRVAVICWAAQHGAALAGDFVECGVNTGIFSLALCEYVGLNALDKSLYLFDTFSGIPDEQMSAGERLGRTGPHAVPYDECYEKTRASFAPFPRATLVRGRVPETLSTVAIERVCYLSIDM